MAFKHENKELHNLYRNSLEDTVFRKVPKVSHLLSRKPEKMMTVQLLGKDCSLFKGSQKLPCNIKKFIFLLPHILSA